jgi:hypothetical protein
MMGTIEFLTVCINLNIDIKTARTIALICRALGLPLTVETIASIFQDERFHELIGE